MQSQIDIPKEMELMLNNIITNFWSMERQYTAMSALCDNTFTGFRECFRFCAIRSRVCLERTRRYLTINNGQFLVNTVQPTFELPTTTPITMITLLEFALKMEKGMGEMLRGGISLADKKNDVTTGTFIQTELLYQQIRTIKWYIYHINGLTQSGNELTYDKIAMTPSVEAWRGRFMRMTNISLFERALLAEFGTTSGFQGCCPNCTCLFKFHGFCLCKCNTDTTIGTMGVDTITEDFFNF